MTKPLRPLRVVKSILTSFDQFGIPINLQIKKQRSFISLGMIVFLAFMFVQLTQDLFQSNNPNIVQSIIYNRDPKSYVFTPENFRLSLVLTDENGQTIRSIQNNKTIYRMVLKACQNTIFYDEQGQRSQISCLKQTNLIPCSYVSRNSFSNQLKLDPAVEHKSYCIDDLYWQDNEIKLSGIGTSSIFEYLDVEVETCKNSTLLSNEPRCAPQEDIDKIISKGYVGLNYVDNLLNQQQHGNPFIPIYKFNLFTYSKRGNIKDVQITLRHSTVLTQNNPFYLFGSTETDHSLQYYKHESVSDFEQLDNKFFSIHIILDDHYNILNVMASVSGLYTVLKTFFGLILIPFSQRTLKQDILNQLYYSRKEQTIKDFGQKDPSQKIHVNSSKKVSGQMISSKIGQEIDPYLKAILKQKSPIKNSKLCDSLQTIKKKDSAMYERKFDAVTIQRKLIEIDQLKRLLLDENQIKLFEFIQKPFRPSSFKQHRKPFHQRIKDAITSYKLLDNDKNQVNQKLCLMMNKDIRLVFHQILQENSVWENIPQANILLVENLDENSPNEQ